METLSTIVIKRRFLGRKNAPKLKQDLIVTSTPIKSRTLKELDMESLSPVENKSNKSPDLFVPTNNIVNGSTAHIQPVQNNNNVETDAVDKSVDKSEEEIEDSALNNIGPKPNDKAGRPVIIMNSDEEEEFWRNRNEPTKGKTATIKSNRSSIETQRSFKKNKMQGQAKDAISSPTAEGTTINSQDHRITLPKITAETSKAVPAVKVVTQKVTLPEPVHARKSEAACSQRGLETSKTLSIDESSKVSDQLFIVKPLERAVEQTSIVDGIELRRSNRKRCKPLEFWNGERMDIDRDLTGGIRRHVAKRNLMETETKEVQNRKKIKLLATELDHSHQAPTIMSNVAHTDESETNLNKGSQSINRRKSALSSRQRSSSEANVRFSTIGTGTTIDGPTRKSILKPDWVINFPGIFAGNKMRPISDDCVVFPGLNAAMGLISSAIMQMRAKSISQSQAPEFHHLIFCVMTGTVTVTINEISERMETFGHFTVPCGVSYSIENIGKQKAVLSFFKISSSCVSM